MSHSTDPVSPRLPWMVAGALTLAIVALVAMKVVRKTQPIAVVPNAAVVDSPNTMEPVSATDSTTRRLHASPSIEQSTSDLAAQHKKIQDAVDAAQTGLAAQFRAETTDASWAAAKERRLAELVSSDQIKSLNADIRNATVVCKSTVCRISGDFPSMTAGDDWFTLYMNNIAGESPYASYKYIPTQDGSVRIEVFAIGRK